MKKITSIGLITFTLATAASAAPNPNMLVGYDFNDESNAFTTAATFSHTNVIASAFGVAPSGGLNVIDGNIGGSGALDAEDYDFGTNNANNFGGPKDVFGASLTGDLANAITNNDYMTFTVTPDGLGAGESFDLTSFTFLSYAGKNTSRAPNEWALFSSVDGFAAAGDAIVTRSTPTTTTWTSNVVTLGSDFNNISTPITFRLYIYGANSSGSTGSQVVFDKVVLNGTVVPESGTYALLAGCLALTSVMLRRRK